jgi:hypothetical protein
VKNDEPEPSKLFSSCSKRHSHVHVDHSDHNRDQYSHHEQQTKQQKKRSLARKQ